MKQYDFLIVGAGLYGATFAYEATRHGLHCLVVDKRLHTGGNIYCEQVDGINVHRYGAHIFHTSDKAIWEFVTGLVEMNRFTNSPVARYKDELYNLPFNMNTFHQLWGVRTPAEAEAKIAEQRAEMQGHIPQNLEEQAISLVGRDIYERLIKGYTEKQWGRACTELPAFIIRRLPVRLTFDNNYFNDRYQGIPVGGYNRLTERLLAGSDIRLDTEFFAHRDELTALCDKVIYTGKIDEYFGYRFGRLEYRSVRFETEELPMPNFQGCAVVNYTEREVPYTRIIEHKHFEFGNQPHTVISREYPLEATGDDVEPYYPVNDERNNALYERYRALGEQEQGVRFGGRLAEYKYYDMHQIIANVLALWK